MTNFLLPSTLDGLYSVKANYYRLQIKGASPIKFRNVLEIKRIGINASTNSDLIVIMMNPGSSSPKLLDWRDTPIYTPKQICTLQYKTKMVDATPDKTQYQIMRIMKAKRLKFARVINLSDKIEANSSIFLKWLTSMKKKSQNDFYSSYFSHSIFWIDRIEELQSWFEKRKDKSPILLAWGADSRLKTLAGMCNNVIPSSYQIGYKAKKKIAITTHLAQVKKL